ncbi:hypothetical protein SSX86_015951 [Deinandra increscens subsp. villosa]|uniref:Protein kinase domain-containing protein n=1 Tax=Deinandra increscens subsp. villosa TaxID=3103831 RepID=A0AAP0D4C3_9ASTR
MIRKFDQKESQVQPPSLGSVRPLVVSQPSGGPVYVYTDGQPPSIGSVRPFVVSQPSGIGRVHIDGQTASQTGASFKILVSTGSALIRKVWHLCKSNPFSCVSSGNKSPHPKSGVSPPFSMSHQDTNLSFSGVSVFTYKELEDATQNFDPARVLGEGGFGVVYYGELQDGREVAVKKLYEHNNNNGIEQFRNEDDSKMRPTMNKVLDMLIRIQTMGRVDAYRRPANPECDDQ